MSAEETVVYEVSLRYRVDIGTLKTEVVDINSNTGIHLEERVSWSVDTFYGNISAAKLRADVLACDYEFVRVVDTDPGALLSD